MQPARSRRWIGRKAGGCFSGTHNVLSGVALDSKPELLVSPVSRVWLEPLNPNLRMRCRQQRQILRVPSENLAASCFDGMSHDEGVEGLCRPGCSEKSSAVRP